MPQVFSGLATAGRFIQANPAAVSLPLYGFQFLQNILAGRQQQRALRPLLEQARMTPEQTMEEVRKLRVPLHGGLVQNVRRQVEAAGAERGLAGSEPWLADVLAQSLAPHERGTWQDAINLFLGRRGSPEGLQGLLPQVQPGTDLLRLLLSPGASNLGSDDMLWNILFGMNPSAALGLPATIPTVPLPPEAYAPYPAGTAPPLSF